MTPPETPPVTPSSRTLLVAALGSGGLLTLMVLCNAEVGRHGGALAASLAPHATGTVAALLALALLPRRAPAAVARVPAWAYLGGLSGAVTVMLTSSVAVTPLGLSGTLALGLLGQVAFGLAADRWGLLGLPRRRATAREVLSLLLILAGSLLLILGARA